jgi:hypothetical protein
MKRLILVPNGWTCAYNVAGEFFWGGAKSHEERKNLIVQPVEAVWEEYEE